MSQFFTARDEVSSWLLQQGIYKFKIEQDLIVNVPDSVKLGGHRLKYLPVQFGIVDGSFNCDFNELISLRGCPREVDSYLSIVGNPLKSLEYLPASIRWTLYMENIPVSGLLRILDVAKLKTIQGLQSSAADIILKALKHRDIFLCQQELIEAGFPEYAQL